MSELKCASFMITLMESRAYMYCIYIHCWWACQELEENFNEHLEACEK